MDGWSEEQGYSPQDSLWVARALSPMHTCLSLRCPSHPGTSAASLSPFQKHQQPLCYARTFIPNNRASCTMNSVGAHMGLVINTAKQALKGVIKAALDDKNFKGSFLSLILLNLPEKRKKKSELDSKLVLGDGKLMNCPPVTEDLAQNLGYLADQSLLVALLWALCSSSFYCGYGRRCMKLLRAVRSWRRSKD